MTLTDLLWFPQTSYTRPSSQIFWAGGNEKVTLVPFQPPLCYRLIIKLFSRHFNANLDVICNTFNLGKTATVTAAWSIWFCSTFILQLDYVWRYKPTSQFCLDCVDVAIEKNSFFLLTHVFVMVCEAETELFLVGTYRERRMEGSSTSFQSFRA